MKRKRNPVVQVLPIVKEEGLNVSKEIARYLLDISKLVIGGAVITSALDIAFDKKSTIIVAGVIAIVFALSGLIVLTYKKNKL